MIQDGGAGGHHLQGGSLSNESSRFGEASPWVLSAAANSSGSPICSVSEALTTVVQPRADAPTDDTTPAFEGTTVPASMSSLAH